MNRSLSLHDGDNGFDDPPHVPSDHVYTSCYCEENVYLLAQRFCNEASEHDEDWPWDVYVVFISNDQKTVRFILGLASCCTPSVLGKGGSCNKYRTD